MQDNRFIFLAGLHRSGTSLLHDIIRSHPQVSGFNNAGVPKNEGQHLQDIIQPASYYGGPGRFAFERVAYMNESHPLATVQSAREIFTQWGKFYDLSFQYLVEKSPPNLVRTRFLQKLFPGSKFVVILRHPIALSYATQKWCKTSIKSLVEHCIQAYEIFIEDMKFLENVYVFRYENFVGQPQQTMNSIFDFLNLKHILVDQSIKENINQKYFDTWELGRKSTYNQKLFAITPELEERVNKLGYSLLDYNNLIDLPWLSSKGLRSLHQ